MAGPEVSLKEVFDEYSENLLARIHTGIPAEIVTYDPEENTIVARVMVKDSFFDFDGERTFEEPPLLTNVPVQWQRGGGYIATVPIGPGDFVWMMFSQAALTEFRSSGRLSEPKDSRRHSMGHAFALPGAFPDCRPMSAGDAPTRASAMVMGEDGGDAQIVITKGVGRSIKIGKSALDFVALSTPTNAAIASCIAASNAVLSALASVVTALASHTHAVAGAVASAPVPGTFPTPPSPAATPGSVAATLVKAK